MIEQALSIETQEGRERFVRLRVPDESRRALALRLLASAEAEPEQPDTIEGDADSVNLRPSSERISPVEVVRKHRDTRYSDQGSLGSGGMGEVIESFDVLLERSVARKGLHTDADAASRPSLERRLLREARVTAALTHSNIPRILNIEVTEDGHLFYTMEIVEGYTLADALAALTERSVQALTPILSALVTVCRTLAYAHNRGVIHRDPKPSNVMLDEYGQVLLLDWGLATWHHESTKSEHSRIEPQPELGTDASLFGHAAGTPHYMPPERLLGAEPSPSEDIYSLGAMLYEVLSGRKPHSHESDHPGIPPVEICERVLRGQLRSILSQQPEAPCELVSIVDRAMQQHPQDRYPSAQHLADDLQRWLEGRTVDAHRGGVLQAVSKFVQRHRRTIAATAFTLMTLFTVGAWVHNSLQSAEQASHLRDIFAELDAISIEASELHPPRSENHAPLTELLRRGEALRSVRSDLRRRLSRTAQRDDQELREKALARLDAFLDPETGLLDGDTPEHGLGLRNRVAACESALWGSIESPAARERWSAASKSIGDLAECPMYRGLHLRPQEGLLPLGPDPVSGCWEFAHLLTGVPPERGSDGELSLTEESSLVFVLIPGGTFLMGAQFDSPQLPNYRLGQQTEFSVGVHTVELTPFFLSKYETTQAQWTRMRRSNPSTYSATSHPNKFTAMHPVETVTWTDCSRTADLYGLLLPTESQWEYAVRGTDRQRMQLERPLLTGAYRNVDHTAVIEGDFGHPLPADFGADDGYTHHCPVDAFASWEFGLHGMHGNVREWCRDTRGLYSEAPPRAGDGLRVVPSANVRALRGSCWMSNAHPTAPVTYRFGGAENSSSNVVGVRFGFALDPSF